MCLTGAKMKNASALFPNVIMTEIKMIESGLILKALGNSNANNALGYNYQYNKYGENNTGRPDFAQNIYDSSLDRAWTYDHVGRLIRAYTGQEARAEWGPNPDGPYARGYDYDQYGNLTQRWGWGGPSRDTADNYNYTPNAKNQNPAHGYDLAGNVTNDGAQSYTYDATGQQAMASMNAITMGYDGDGLRLKKTENGTTTYYLRSTVLGQQTVCEINASGAWQRGYVYLGGQLLAIQDVPQNRVLWTHQEPYSKAQRITDAAGAFVSGVEVEPFGLETNRSFDWNGTNQKRKFTTYDRDANGGDEAMMRRYAPKQDRFAQPDPYDGSMSLANPQSLNRYAYTENDPVNFVDPLGLFLSAPTQVCFQVISGTHWDFADGTRITVINERRIYCLSGGSGGSGLELGIAFAKSVLNDPACGNVFTDVSQATSLLDKLYNEGNLRTVSFIPSMPGIEPAAVTYPASNSLLSVTDPKTGKSSTITQHTLPRIDILSSVNVIGLLAYIILHELGHAVDFEYGQSQTRIVNDAYIDTGNKKQDRKTQIEKEKKNARALDGCAKAIFGSSLKFKF
jgi:RHS repeat-associated protein